MARKAVNGEGTLGKVERIKKDGSKTITYFAEITLSSAKTIFTDKGRITTPRQAKRFYGRTQKEAIEKRDKWKLENYKSSFVQPTVKTVRSHLESWFASKRNLKESTHEVSKIYINSYILPNIGNIQLQKLTKENIDDMLNTLKKTGGRQKKGLASSTCRKVYFLLFQALEAAVNDEILPKNPINNVESPKAVKGKQRPLTKGDIKMIFKEGKDDKLFPAVLIAISTGIRRGELLALTWDDIDFKEGTLTINKQLIPIKGGTDVTNLKTERSNRIIGIPQKVIDCLKELHKIEKPIDEKFKKYFIVSQENGRHYHPRNFQSLFDKFLDQLNIEKRSPHQMRHTYATQLLSAGSYVNEVQNSLGHMDASTTLAVYGHILPGRQRELASQMNKLLPD